MSTRPFTGEEFLESLRGEREIWISSPARVGVFCLTNWSGFEAVPFNEEALDY